MPKVRVHAYTTSIDGYAAGPDQSLENPMGVRRTGAAPVDVRRARSATKGSTSTSLRAADVEHRRHDHGAQHVRPRPRSVGERGLEGLVG